MFYVSSVQGQLREYERPAKRVEAVSTSKAAAAVTQTAVQDRGEGQGSLSSKEQHNPYEKLDEPIPTRAPAVLAEQIMTSPVLTLLPGESVQKAGRVFREKRFRHIPVVDEEKKVVGIVSDRDYHSLEQKDVKVKDMMSSDVICALPNTEIRMIAKVLLQERIGAMPIVNEDGILEGMITRSDILRAVVNKAPLEIWV